MSVFSNIICELTHRRYWHDRAEGDWIIRKCAKCPMTWPVPRLGGEKIYKRETAQ